MIGNNYKVFKDNTIDIFNGYIEKRENINDGVDLKFLKQRMNDLETGKFLLSVAGEVKAGKSTFINALLGKEILPSDVLQATSAIVEIFKSDTSYLKVVYADGSIEELYDDLTTKDIDEAKERLGEICKIDDEYREIPHTLINECIKESDGKLEVSKELIKRLESLSGLTLQDKKQLIANYISKNTKNKIPVEINFGYPLNWDFKELRIVDSPGVNAIGGVQDISLKFLEKANAILFVHPIKPIESESFKNFVNKTISNRSKENLFLILTHKGIYEEEEVERLLNEAKRLYGGIISEDKIIAVDSVLELINSELKSGVSLKKIRENNVKKKILSSYREQAEDEERELENVLNEASNFEQIYKTIDEYSMKAPELQLKEILDTIKRGYAEQDKLFSEKIGRLNLKKQSPQSFAREIERISEVLDSLKLKFNEIKIEANESFGGGLNSEIVKNFNEISKKYTEIIQSNKEIQSFKKQAIDFDNDMSDAVTNFSNSITAYFTNKLKDTGEEFQKTHKVTIPKIDLEAIENFAIENSYETIDVYATREVDGWDFFTLGIARLFRDNKVKIGTKEELNNEKYLENISRQITEYIQETKTKMLSQTNDILKDYLKEVNSKINNAIDERKIALEIEKEECENNDEILDEIKKLEKKNEKIANELKRINEILEEIPYE